MHRIVHRILAGLTLAIFVLIQKPLPTQAATSQVYWYGCYRTTNGTHFANGLDHVCREYPIRRAHTRLTGYTKHCRQTGIRIEVYCVRYPTFYVAPPPQPPLTGFEPNVARWAPTIYAASRAYGVPARFIAAIMTVETHGDPNAVSSAGAIGLMQLLPGTAASLGVNPWDPTQNVYGGTHYLAMNGAATLDRGRLFYAAEAYNAGPGNIAAGYSYAAAVMSRY